MALDTPIHQPEADNSKTVLTTILQSAYSSDTVTVGYDDLQVIGYTSYRVNIFKLQTSVV